MLRLYQDFGASITSIEEKSKFMNKKLTGV